MKTLKTTLDIIAAVGFTALAAIVFYAGVHAMLHLFFDICILPTF